MEPVIITEDIGGSLADNGIHMDGINDLQVFVLIHNALDGPEHMIHGLAQIFAAVSSQHDQPAASSPIQFWMGIVLSNRGFQRINGSITGHINGVGDFSFLQKVVAGCFGGGKIILGDNTHSQPVKFLRIGGIDVVGTKPGFHMAHRNLQIEAGEGSDKGGGSVAVNQHDIRLFGFQHGLDPLQNIGGDIKQSLLS